VGTKIASIIHANPDSNNLQPLADEHSSLIIHLINITFLHEIGCDARYVQGEDCLKRALDIEIRLTVAGAVALPKGLTIGEEDDILATGLTDRVDGLLLLRVTGDGMAIGVTLSRPARLSGKGLLAAFVLDDVELALDEATGVARGHPGIEVGVDVGAGNVDAAAELVAVLLPHIDGLGRHVRTWVTGGRQHRLAALDEPPELAGRAEVPEHGLVANDDSADHVPLAPGNEVVDLLLVHARETAAVLLDKDASNQLQALLLAGIADVFESVAVGRVNAESVEAHALDLVHVAVHFIPGLAAPFLTLFVRRVGNGPVILAISTQTRASTPFVMLALALARLVCLLARRRVVAR